MRAFVLPGIGDDDEATPGTRRRVGGEVFRGAPGALPGCLSSFAGRSPEMPRSRAAGFSIESRGPPTGIVWHGCVEEDVMVRERKGARDGDGRGAMCLVACGARWLAGSPGQMEVHAQVSTGGRRVGWGGGVVP